MNLNINDDIINLNVSENSTKIESSNNNIELNISNNNMNVEGETKELNLGILPPKVVVSEKDHSKLLNRDLPNQHPIKAIEGLKEALANAGKKDEHFVSSYWNGNSFYSYTGAKTLEGIKIPYTNLDYLTIIEAMYFVLDYGLDDFIQAYPYAKRHIFGMIIPYEVYINDIESKYITIDLYNKGKAIIEVLNTDNVLSCNKLTIINYLEGWTIECTKDDIKKLTPTVPTNTSELVNDSGFITNLAKDLVNYYLKSEVYTKEEINELASTLQNVSITIVSSLPSTGKTNVIYFVSKTGSTNDVYDEWIYVNNAWEHIGSTEVDLTGYATEKWVKDKDYMPIPDFMEYMDFMYYDMNEIDEMFEEHYTKEEIDEALKDLPTGGTQLTGGDNTVIEDNKINVYTNTGYKVSDKDIQLQSITDSETTGDNHIVYIDEKEIVIVYDGTNKIRRSENGIDFEVITLPVECKYMVYNFNYKRIYGTDKSSNFIYSEDTGLTWQTISSTYASGLHQMAIGFGAGFRATYKSTKEIINFTFNESTNNISVNSRIKSTIVPEFTEMVNNTQYVWCNANGTFRYGAGSSEGNFPSPSGMPVNLLKRVNNITMLGFKNDNTIFLLEPASSITNYKWIEYTLPDTCTVNDIIFNSNDETYYIFTDINTYYKTKDFVNYEPVDKNSLRGIQGSFTLEGIQMTTSNHNELLLAPTRTKQENQNQNLKRLTKKELWLGKGLELEDGRFNVKINGDSLIVSEYGISIRQIDDYNLPEYMIESIYVAVAEEKDLFDPYEVENWYYSGEAYPEDTTYRAVKFLFSQAGSFYDQVTWETEYVVEQYEYGYLFYDVNFSVFKYVKLGNKSWMFE